MNRFQAPLNTSLQKGIKTVIICLEKQVTKIEESINKIIEQNENMSRKKEILMTVPGIGPVTAASLLGLLPELWATQSKASCKPLWSGALCAAKWRKEPLPEDLWRQWEQGGQKIVSWLHFLNG